MAFPLMLVPVNEHVDLNAIALDLADACKQADLKVKLYSPISDSKAFKLGSVASSFSIEEAENLFINNKFDEALDSIIAQYNQAAEQVDIVLIESVIPSNYRIYSSIMNKDIATALNARIVLVGKLADDNHQHINHAINIAAKIYKGKNALNRVIGCTVDGLGPKSDFLTSEVPYFSNKPFSFDWINSLALATHPARLSAALFRYNSITAAQKAKKTIILPEGKDLRILKAANICAQRNIANCVVLGDKEKIRQLTKKHKITLAKTVKIIDPEKIRAKYINPLVALRKHKGLTEKDAIANLENNNVLATMMLKQGDVDGMVSGASHTTADTVRPALQLIKTAPDINAVSSIFFICLQEQVLVYGDCAVNLDPSAEELADIAISSNASAKLFGIDPKVAMISYSTGESGHGVSVDKVRLATEIVKLRRPDIVIDGPMQYDAAVSADVAKLKAPDSCVAGQATVFIFPNLDTGNALYKAVQRSVPGALAVGPLLQGLAKPVNDLSRGALVDDIVFTIALTAVQAVNKE